MEKYDNLDGLKAISCIGIMVMHIKANTNYQISGWVWNSLIPSLTLFVYLFLMLSGFGMFCGYYERVKNGKIDWNQFYTKRYMKILPFFAFLILIDLMMERSVGHIIEGLTEATLVFGLLPNNNPSVIGVGWTLGVIFLFYMLFPFFVWLCWTKKRAWVSFAVSCVLTVFCSIYFFKENFVVADFSARHNFLYCAPYFMGGGITYLYRKEIRAFVSRFRWLCLGGCIAITELYYTLIDPKIDNGDPGIWLLIFYIPWLCYAISIDSKILSNKVMKYLSGISLEIYLAQMVIFRVVEKTKCLYLFGTGWISFLAVWIEIILGLIIFIEIYKFAVRLVTKKVKSSIKGAK